MAWPSRLASKIWSGPGLPFRLEHCAKNEEKKKNGKLLLASSCAATLLIGRQPQTGFEKHLLKLCGARQPKQPPPCPCLTAVRILHAVTSREDAPLRALWNFKRSCVIRCDSMRLRHARPC